MSLVTVVLLWIFDCFIKHIFCFVILQVRWIEQQEVKRRVKRDNVVTSPWDPNLNDPQWPLWYLVSVLDGFVGIDLLHITIVHFDWGPGVKISKKFKGSIFCRWYDKKLRALILFSGPDLVLLIWSRKQARLMVREPPCIHQILKWANVFKGHLGPWS